MKRIFAFILALLMVLSLCACGGGGGTKATIVDNNGNTVQMSAKELAAVYEENEAKYKNTYQKAKCTVDGTVDSVESFLESYGSSRQSVYRITLNEGWQVTVLEKGHEEVIDLSKGDKVQITSYLQIPWGSIIRMEAVHYNSSGFHDETTIVVK